MYSFKRNCITVVPSLKNSQKQAALLFDSILYSNGFFVMKNSSCFGDCRSIPIENICIPTQCTDWLISVNFRISDGFIG